MPDPGWQNRTILLNLIFVVMKQNTLLLLALLLAITASSQHHTDRYVPETDPLVLEKLEQYTMMASACLRPSIPGIK